MSNTINQNNVIIKQTPNRVWEALTTSEGMANWLLGTIVVSDWKIGTNIEYTCYNSDGTVLVWNDMEMIWKGVITEFEINKIYKVKYNGSGGIIEETYILEVHNEGTQLTFVQECVDEKVAKSYEEGNKYTLKAIKEFLEK